MSSVDPTDQKKTACYDIDVEVDDPLKSQMNSFLSSTTNQQEIAALEMKVRRVGQSDACTSFHVLVTKSEKLYCLCSLQIHETIEYINQLKTERDFMLSFSNNPQDFIQDWLKSQSRDLKVNLWFTSNFPHKLCVYFLLLYLTTPSHVCFSLHIFRSKLFSSPDLKIFIPKSFWSIISGEESLSSIFVLNLIKNMLWNTLVICGQVTLAN